MGLKLHLLAAPDGMPVAWGLATPKLGEREVAAALLGLASDQGLLRPGMVIAADKGLAGTLKDQLGLERHGATIESPPELGHECVCKQQALSQLRRASREPSDFSYGRSWLASDDRVERTTT